MHTARSAMHTPAHASRRLARTMHSELCAFPRLSSLTALGISHCVAAAQPWIAPARDGWDISAATHAKGGPEAARTTINFGVVTVDIHSTHAHIVPVCGRRSGRGDRALRISVCIRVRSQYWRIVTPHGGVAFTLMRVMCGSLAAHDDIHQLARHHDDLDDALAGDAGLNALIAQRLLLDRVFGRADRHRDAVAELSVDLYH
jgi:hypothetical protein